MSDSEDQEVNEESVFIRENRKRPREFSTKAPVERNALIVPKKKVRYDPRYECGDFDRVQFNRDYAFINDMRKNELKKLKKVYGKTENKQSKKAEQMKASIKVLENQLRATDEQNAELEAKAELREENIRRMNEGFRPVYLNRKQLRTKIMEKRYEKIKSQGSIKTYLKKKKAKEFKKRGLEID